MPRMMNTVKIGLQEPAAYDLHHRGSMSLLQPRSESPGWPAAKYPQYTHRYHGRATRGKQGSEHAACAVETSVGNFHERNNAEMATSAAVKTASLAVLTHGSLDDLAGLSASDRGDKRLATLPVPVQMWMRASPVPVQLW